MDNRNKSETQSGEDIGNDVIGKHAYFIPNKQRCKKTFKAS
jgi:hypothetical protein